MRRISGFFALAMVLTMCLTPSVFGQRGPGGPGGPGGFGGFGGRGGMPGGASQLIGMLRMEEVRKEVKVSEEAYKAIEEAQQASREKMRELRDMSEADRTKFFAELNTKSQELLDEVLEPTSMKRLMGLYVQQSGNRAAMNDLIAKEIGLSEDGIKKVTEAMEKAFEEMRPKMEALRNAGGGGQGGFDREKFSALMAESQKNNDEAIAGVLTDEQKKALEALKGEKFTFPEGGGFGGFGGRGPGGPGGQPGGGRPGGGRPRPDNN